VALVAAIVLAVIGCATVAFVGGARYTIPTYALVLVLAWEYSAPPLRLCATGLGELDTAIVVTGLVPWLGFYLQAPDLAGLRTLLVAIVPLALLQIAMLLAIEFPDAAGDAATGKRTLVVRLGAARAAKLYVAITALAYAWLPVGYALGLPARAALLAAVPAPVALWRVVQIADHSDPAAYERLTFFAVFLLVSTAAATAIGFMN
jgi:1,4-dihydroxy-2-naphthoate octaprenyltransferase